MTQAATKNALHFAIDTHNNSVVALSGDWGTGKTHLLRTLKNELEEQKGYKVLSLSAFSFKSVDDLKTSLTTQLASMFAGVIANQITDAVVPNVMPGLVGKPVQQIISFGADIGKSFLPAGLQMRLSDAHIFLPRLRGKLPAKFLITIDDIERTEKVDISELFGFVNFLTEELNVRLLLILNSERLEGQRLAHWNLMREKIVSRLVGLEISAAEAAGIAFDDMPQHEAEALKHFCVKLNLTNIRIAQHIRRNWEAIRGIKTLDEQVTTGLIKSVVLLTAVHLKATNLKEWPDKDFILKNHFSVGDDDSTEHAGWSRKLREYDFGYADDFEGKVLLPFLDTGQLDMDAFDVYLKEAGLRSQREEIGRETQKLGIAHWWGLQANKTSILAMVDDLMKKVKAMTAAQISGISEIAHWYDIEKSEEIVDLWIGQHRSSIMGLEVIENTASHFNPPHRKIAKIYEERRIQLYPPLTLIEAIRYIQDHNGWSERHEQPIIDATFEDYEQLIRSVDPEDFQVMFAFFEPLINGRFSGTKFMPASKRFFDAIVSIIQKSPRSRPAQVLVRVLESNGLERLLVPAAIGPISSSTPS